MPTMCIPGFNSEISTQTAYRDRHYNAQLLIMMSSVIALVCGIDEAYRKTVLVAQKAPSCKTLHCRWQNPCPKMFRNLAECAVDGMWSHEAGETYASGARSDGRPFHRSSWVQSACPAITAA